VVTSTALRGRAEATPEVRPTVCLTTPAERIAYALVMRPASKADEDEGRTPEVTTNALKVQLARARADLCATPEGRDLARRILAALAGPAAELAQLPKRSTLELRPFTADAAVRFVALLQQYDLETPEELEAAAEYVLNRAIAKAARSRLFGVGFGALSTTRTSTLDDGAKFVTRLPAGGDLAAIARTHSQESRIWMLTLRDLVKERGPSTKLPAPSEVAERDAAIIAERERRAAHAAARAAAEPEPTHEDDDQEHPAEEQDAGHPLVGPTPTPPSLDALGRAPRPGQHAHRPTPTAVPEIPRAPVLAWLPVELHPWAAKFGNLEPLPPIQRVHGACGIVGSLQAAGAFARAEARIVGAVQQWRALFMATGVLPTVEGGST
jgi:hypothetical protein